MNGLPIALQRPENGRYSVETAVSIWLQVAYGFPYGVPNEGRDYKRARSQAAAELRHLVRSEDVSTAPSRDGRLPIGVSVINRRPSSWFPNDRPPRPMQTVRITWIEQTDLIRFAAEHGVELFAESDEVMPEPSESGRKLNPATRYALELRRSGEATSDRDAATQAVNKFHPELHKDVIKSKIESIERRIREKRKKDAI